ncbi:MAG: hypothetical protein L3J44_02020 [Campylobacteraceae bacterium]|nr:hypothetical protein [Campylobacteraceae bacterium]
MLQTENFIYFFTVCGFFIGVIFSVLNFSSPYDILMYSGAITLFFYLFVHIVAINFVDYSRIGKMMFNKKEYEEISDYFVKELDFREDRLDILLLELDKINKKYMAQKNKNPTQATQNMEQYHKAA